MKTYDVYFWIKANRTETLNIMQVAAANAKEACAKCKVEVKERTGRNAFRPTTKCPVIAEKYRDDDGCWIRLDRGYKLEGYFAESVIHEDTFEECEAVLKKCLVVGRLQ